MVSQNLVLSVIAISMLLVAGIALWGSSRSADTNLLTDAPTSAEIQLDEFNTETTAAESNETTALDGPRTPDEQRLNNQAMQNETNPIALLETNYGAIEIELYEDVMPITAGNFAKLIEEGYYNGIKFHRVIDGFMIQGGDPNTKTANVASYGTGGPGYAIQDEFVEREYLSNVRGTISMANSGPNTGGSQFFINLVDNTGLDFDKQPLSSKHPVFGKVISGMDVVDSIGSVETGPRDLPVEDVVIERATIVRR